MNQIITVVIPSILIIASSVLQLIVHFKEMKKLKTELEGTKAIIKDTGDLRSALMRPLEGVWILSGEFSKFQGDLHTHFSSGVLMLIWNVIEKRYEAYYCYSVIKEWTNNPCVTAICRGFSIGDINKSHNLTFQFDIESRTIKTNNTNYSQRFIMEIDIKNNNGVLSMSSSFSTDITKGILRFQRSMR